MAIGLARLWDRHGDEQSTRRAQSEAVVDETGGLERRLDAVRSLKSARWAKESRKVLGGTKSGHTHPLRLQVFQRFTNVQYGFDLEKKKEMQAVREREANRLAKKREGRFVVVVVSLSGDESISFGSIPRWK